MNIGGISIFGNQITARSGNVGLVIEYASNSDASNADDTTSFVNSISGSLVPTVASSTKKKRVQFTNAIQPTDIITLEVMPSGIGWMNASDAGYNHDETNVVEYGISLYPITSTTVDVVFWTAGIVSGLTLSSSTWSNENSIGTRWRVTKVSPHLG